MILFFDTETTGIPARGVPAGSPMHPHICQLGAQLVDDTGRVVAEMNLLVKPQNWSVPAEAAAVHGITTAMCEQYGFSIATVIKLLMQFVRRAKKRVAHNLPFDDLLCETELIRIKASDDIPVFQAIEGYCTMEAATPIMALPPTYRMRAAGYDKHKPPNLREAHRFFLNSDFEGAHDAMADVNACRRLYYAIQKYKKPVQQELPRGVPPLDLS